MAGGLTVEVEETGPPLAVRVSPARGPPGSVGPRMRLTLGARSYDLTTRAMEVRDADAPVAEDDAALDRALAAGAGIVRLTNPSADALAQCAEAGVAVIVPAAAIETAAAAGLPADRVVPDTLLVDVTGDSCPAPVTAVAVIRGARIVRASDVRAARRVCDVLAAVMEAQ